MKLSITKRVKEFYVEYTACYYIERKNKKIGVHGKKLLSNLARARREIIELVSLNLVPDSCLLTLTYRENMQDYEKAYKDYYNFVKMVRYKFGISLKYVRVIELQKRGAIHFHVVVFNPEFVNVPYSDIYKTWGHGAVHIRRIDLLDDLTADRIGNYLGKYLTKSKEIAVNKKIYTTSKGLKRPEKQRIVIEDEKQSELYLKYLADASNFIIAFEGNRKMIKFIKARKLEKGVKNS